MPNSARMRDGEVDASRLVRLADAHVKGKAEMLIRDLSRKAKEITITTRRLKLITDYAPSKPKCARAIPAVAVLDIPDHSK